MVIINIHDYLLAIDGMVGGGGEMEDNRCSASVIVEEDTLVEKVGRRGGWIVGVVTGATLVEKVGRRGGWMVGVLTGETLLEKVG